MALVPCILSGVLFRSDLALVNIMLARAAGVAAKASGAGETSTPLLAVSNAPHLCAVAHASSTLAPTAARAVHTSGPAQGACLHARAH